MKFCISKMRKHEEEIILENKIKTLEQEIMQYFDNISEDNLQLLDQKKEMKNLKGYCYTLDLDMQT